MSNFICLSGDCDNFALTKDGCFVVRDEQGRDWLCYEPENLRSDASEAMSAVQRMQEKLHRLGFQTDGTYFSVVTSIDLEVLPLWLDGA